MNFSTNNAHLNQWVNQLFDLCKPDSIHLCDGSDDEYNILASLLVKTGTFIKLNEDKRPNSYYCQSDPTDVARVEDRTFICTDNPEDAGPTNNWMNPDEMKTKLTSLFNGCMKGRTMYVIPFSMGPLGSKISYTGVQITDSPYVVCSMKIMTRMGKEVMKFIEGSKFVKCLHSVGKPLNHGDKDAKWSCNEEKYIVHFPEEKSIWSFGSGYGGNALLGKKCFALRIASYLAKKEGWLAEHMLILAVTNPKGEKKYFAGAFPSACGKTNLAMLTSTIPGWNVETVGDDIAWMKFGDDGRLYAVNPETGFFGVAPGTSIDTNPNAMLSMRQNSIFTNVALTQGGDVWWEGMTKQEPDELINWLNHKWMPGVKERAAHPNSRYTVPAKQCPVMDPEWENPAGVPISVILFGGRREKTIPLVYEAFNWQHGTFLGSIIASEKTAAADGELGKLRHDPFAMLPFCGYNMADYFNHWLSIGKLTDAKKLPKIFSVNWFRKNSEGKYLWPGFGDNIRVLKWIFERIDDDAAAVESPIGYLPYPKALKVDDLDISPQDRDELFYIDKNEWLNETISIERFYSTFGNKIPNQLIEELGALKNRLSIL
jgi:phosphoenolpyruvate carboxykinase (GTP)